MRRACLGILALALASCATVPQPDETLDSLAQDYVVLQLAIGEKEDGYIDAYYGPDELRERSVAELSAKDLPQLEILAAALRKRIDRYADDGVQGTSMDERRARFLVAQLTAAHTRLRMMQGEQIPFVQEAEGLFGVTPETPALESFDPVLARIERLVPAAEGSSAPLWKRLDDYYARFNIPEDRLQAVFDASIAECKRRTLEHIAMPEGESFTLRFVTDKPWSGYNYYQGGYASKIEVNTDLPIRLDRAVDLGCHEGYPGHHAFNALLEKNLVNDRGWTEFSIYPLYSPQSLIAEGSANYGIPLAFPGEEQVRFETEVLAPLAGLPTEDLAEYAALRDALKDLGPARYTIAAEYLASRMSGEEAIELLQRYQLVSPERAAQSLRFIDTYRSYIINYGLGRDMVSAWIERGDADATTRWKRMERLLSEPSLPSDLLAE